MVASGGPNILLRYYNSGTCLSVEYCSARCSGFDEREGGPLTYFGQSSSRKFLAIRANSCTS